MAGKDIFALLRLWIVYVALSAAAVLSTVVPMQAQTFQLSGVKFSSSDYLSDAELQGAVAPYLNRDIEFPDVEKMVAAVQGLYLSKGIVTAQAIIEPQQVADGILKLTLVEAELAQVKVDGAKDTKPEFVMRRLSAQQGAKPDFDRLARDLRLFEVAYDIRPKLSFSPGDLPGTATAVISIEEPKKFSWVASLDNFASEALGETQLSLAATVRSLTGHRDVLSVKATATQGSEGLSFYYNRPVGLQGGSVSVSGSYTQSEIVRGEFSIINIATEDLKFSTGYSQPIWIERDRFWTVSADLNYEKSDSVVAGTALQSNDLIELDVGLAFQQKRLGQAWSVSGGLKFGNVDSNGASASDGRYELLYGSASYARRMGDNFVLDANLDVQFADGQNLSVRRRFTGGGVTSLRGFEKDVRSGDSGAIVRLQLTCPSPCMGEEKPKVAISPFAFVDFGIIKPFKAAAAAVDTQDHLASVGIGARVNVKNVNLLGFVGAPVIKPAGLTKTSPRAYFGADYAF